MQIILLGMPLTGNIYRKEKKDGPSFPRFCIFSKPVPKQLTRGYFGNAMKSCYCTLDFKSFKYCVTCIVYPGPVCFI